ncbi:mobilization protein [Fusobacterium nucleatum]|jgi:hypothetical protein|uniref:mobilization protein n=1 Tax=Fusobacterium nucleatum TaxID=851 RepID=UPI0030D51450
MSKTVKRKNNCIVHFMVNEEDMKKLNRKFALTNFKNKKKFYRKSVFKTRIISIDISGDFRKELRELSSLVSSNSANLNQITKHINSTGVIYKKDIELIHSGLELELSFLMEFREKASDYIINKLIS